MEKKEVQENYLSPTVDIVEVILEQGILQTSGYEPSNGSWD